MIKADYLDSGGYQPSTQDAAPDLSLDAAAAAKAVSSTSQSSYDLVIDNIDLNLFKDYAFIFSYILTNDDPADKTVVFGPPSPRFIVTRQQIAAAVPDYTEAPANVVVTSGLLSYQVKWDKPTWANYVDTIIWEGTSSTFTGSETVVWVGNSTQANILTSTTADRYIKILHRDKFFHADTTSANKYYISGVIKPTDPVVVDIDGPPAVGSATVTGGIDPSAYLGFNGYATIQWSAVTSGGIRGYRIRFKPVGDSVYSYADSPGSGTSYKLEGLGVGVTYEFAVATYDQYNNTTSGYVSGGTLAIPGTPVMNGYISAGAFKFGDGVVSGKRGLLFNSSNYWYINSGSTAEFKVGGPTSNYIKWDGSTLNIDGNIGATGTATIGGNINLSTSGASIYNGTINTAGTLTGNGFALNSTGLKIANGANSVTLNAADGTITANAGTIGGWTLSPTTLSRNNISLDSAGQIRAGSSLTASVYIDGTTTWGVAGMPGTYYKLWSGNNNPANASFSVDSSGVLRATNAIISGSIGLGSTFGTSKTAQQILDDTIAAKNAADSALQPNGTLTGNVSGTVDGVAASTVRGNAAKGATAVQSGNGLSVDATTRVINALQASNNMKISSGGTRPVTLDDTGLYMTNPSTGLYSILLDASTGTAIFRGDVYADNGYFKGSITGASGTFKGNVELISNSTDWFSSPGVKIESKNLYNQNQTAWLYAGSLTLGTAGSYAYIISGNSSGGVNDGSLVLTSDAGQIHLFGVNQGSGIIYANRSIMLGQGQTANVSFNANDLTRIWSDGRIFANSLNSATGSGNTSGTSVVQNSSGYLKVLGSSRTLKENIIEIPKSGYLNATLRVKPVNFNYINNDVLAIEPIQSGLIAEDLALIPEFRGVVNYNLQGDPISIGYDRMSALLVLAIQELKDEVDTLKERLDGIQA